MGASKVSAEHEKPLPYPYGMGQRHPDPGQSDPGAAQAGEMGRGYGRGTSEGHGIMGL